MTKKISIKDIAKELKLSITTVSFVINGKGKEMGISPATINKVLELIQKRDYRPNNAARILRTGKSNTIGVIVEDLGNYFFGNIAKVIEREANQRGFNVFISSTENNAKTARDLIRKMRNSLVDGLIITPTKGLKEEIQQLADSKIPFVLLDRTIPDVRASHVILNNYHGAYTLTEHLVKNGYRKIGFVTIASDMSMMADRLRGYEQALSDENIRHTDKHILKVKFDDPPQFIIEQIRKFISGTEQFDALFFATNYLGVHGLEALKEAKIRIPDQVGVVSFDDNDLFRLYTPSVTVASQPIEKIAVETIDLLLSIMNDHEKQGKPIGKVLKPLLVKRQSSVTRKKNAA
jgi:LacI family transcriptional regulator